MIFDNGIVTITRALSSFKKIKEELEKGSAICAKKIIRNTEETLKLKVNNDELTAMIHKAEKVIGELSKFTV